MAKNTGSGRRVGAVVQRSQTKNPRTGMWVKRNTTTGKFVGTKKSGGAFKGVKREN